MIHAPPIDFTATRANYLKRYRNLSWTKLQQFERCPAAWFAENFAVFRGTQARRQDHLYAFPGTIIQRVWEALINGRVYERPGLCDAEALAAWCRAQARALFRLTVFPAVVQWAGPPAYWRRYFDTDEGEAWRRQAVEQHGLDPVFDGHLSPQFVGESDLTRVYGSPEESVARIGGTFARTIDVLHAAGIGFSQTEAEKYVAVDFGDFRIAGQIDFLVRADGGDRLRDGYKLLDGKFRIGSTVEIGQLYFYALLVERTQGIRPGWLGFLDYSSGCLVGADGDGADRGDRQHELTARAERYVQAANALAETFRQIVGDVPQFDIRDLRDLSYQPNRQSCGFCSIAVRCTNSQGIFSRP
jgi:hypothetical protein